MKITKNKKTKSNTDASVPVIYESESGYFINQLLDEIGTVFNPQSDPNININFYNGSFYTNSLYEGFAIENIKFFNISDYQYRVKRTDIDNYLSNTLSDNEFYMNIVKNKISDTSDIFYITLNYRYHKLTISTLKNKDKFEDFKLLSYHDIIEIGAENITLFNEIKSKLKNLYVLLKSDRYIV